MSLSESTISTRPWRELCDEQGETSQSERKTPGCGCPLSIALSPSCLSTRVVIRRKTFDQFREDHEVDLLAYCLRQLVASRDHLDSAADHKTYLPISIIALDKLDESDILKKE